MFVVIQQIQKKKADPYGAYKELSVSQESWTINNLPARWKWEYSGERFERPHREAYKISVHESYREGGKVRKRQYCITTMDYYSMAQYCFQDCTNSKRLQAIADKLNISREELEDMIYEKLRPIQERITEEFHQSEEYITEHKHDDIIRKHDEAAYAFAKKYRTDRDDYERCYNLFGELVNPDYLKQVKAKAKAYRRSYYDYSDSTYSGGSGSDSRDYSSYFAKASSTYTDEDKGTLKRFYKVLSMKFHPDLNPDTDTTKEMQLLNRLKEDWGV